MDQVFIFSGAGIALLWGIAHIAPIRFILADFGKITESNRRILTMEWVSEGLTLCFIGMLVLSTRLVSEVPTTPAVLVYRGSALMLIVMAILSYFTGAKTKIVPMKVCPYVKTGCAILIFCGSFL